MLILQYHYYFSNSAIPSRLLMFTQVPLIKYMLLECFSSFYSHKSNLTMVQTHLTDDISRLVLEIHVYYICIIILLLILEDNIYAFHFLLLNDRNIVHEKKHCIWFALKQVGELFMLDSSNYLYNVEIVEKAPILLLVNFYKWIV